MKTCEGEGESRVRVRVSLDEVKETTIRLAKNRDFLLRKAQFIMSTTMKFKPSGGKILEIGFGSGYNIIPIAARGYMVFGIEIVPRMVAELRKIAQKLNLSQNIHVIRGDAERQVEYPELNQEFDVIIVSEVLEHVPHPAQVLHGIKRLLKRDGLLIVTIPNGFGPYSLIADVLVGGFLPRVFRFIPKSEHVRQFSLTSFRNLLTPFGFKIIGVQNGMFLYFVFRHMPIPGQRLAKYDDLLAKKVPRRLASFWRFLIQHE